MSGLRGVLIHDLQDAVMRHAAGGRTAIIDTRGTVSYATFARMVDHYAGGVRERIDGQRGTLVGSLRVEPLHLLQHSSELCKQAPVRALSNQS